MVDKLISHKGKENIAIIDTEGRKITYFELINSARHWANYYNAINASDNIILFTGNCIEFAIGLYSIWMSGRSAILLDTYSEDSDIDIMAQKFFCDTIVKSDHTKSVKSNCKNIIYSEIVKKRCTLKPNERCIPQNAIYFHTSGTTHDPKIVPITFKGIIEECKALKKVFLFGEKFIDVIIFPITSVSGCLGQLVPMIYSGGVVLIYEGKLSMKKIGRFVKEYKPTRLVCTPSIFSLMVLSNTVNPQDFDSVKIIVLCGEPSESKLMEQGGIKFYNAEITQAYGLTEAASAVTSSYRTNAPYDSVGKVLDNVRVRIVKDEEPQGNNCLGEIQIKGSSVMKGYYNNKALNSTIFDGDWMKTGDIGFVDDNNYLYIKGRIRNIILVNGKTVYAEEIERIVKEYPAIENVQIYSKPSKVTGEKIVADIVIKKDCIFAYSDFKRFCHDNMKEYMVPVEIHKVKNIQLAPSGKKCIKLYGELNDY